MWYRIAFVLITIFFLVMNTLLWRAELSGRNVGSAVPAEIVWRKILTAPDSSPLEIRHRGAKVGALRWVPSVTEEYRPGVAEHLPPEGMIKSPSQYDLEMDGHFNLSERERMAFNFSLRLGTNYVWENLSLRVTLRPQVLELRSYARERSLRVIVIQDGERSERAFTFEELQNPEKLVREFAGPWFPAGLLAGMLPLGMSAPKTGTGTGAPAGLASGIEWEARSDTLQLGSAKIRGYRLRANLLGRFQASLFVNTLGEVVRLELPDQIVLMNEGLISL